MKKKILSVLLSVAMVSTLMAGTTGCGKKEEPEVATTTEATTTEEITTEEQDIGPEGMARSFLTGEWVDEKIANQRPVAFMIENTSMSVPSYNSSKADVYYEAPEEGGITRIMALYNDVSDLGTIGNIRSTRPYFVYAAMAFDAILAHCGGSVETYDQLLVPGYIDSLDERIGSGGYYREDSRSAPHNLYADSEKIKQAITDHGYATTYPEEFEGYFKFNKNDQEEIQLDGKDAAVVVVYQADCKPWFVYNEEDGLYYRYEFKKEQMDAETNTQLAVKNVIIQECSVEPYYDKQNHDRVDIGITKGGKGKYITNGKAIDITWKCESSGDVTHFYDKNGDEIILNQGKTWINVMDESHSSDNVIYATVKEYEEAK
ncbi:MAG: DUF3048 domain-containing protein [Lachnospiraceae bacterium]